MGERDSYGVVGDRLSPHKDPSQSHEHANAYKINVLGNTSRSRLLPSTLIVSVANTLCPMEMTAKKLNKLRSAMKKL